MRWSSLIVLFGIALIAVRGDAGDKEKKEPEKAADKKPYLLVVPPAGGKEVKLADWRFTHGTRRLALTGDTPVNPKTKTPAGPEYLEVREEKTTTYKNGIFTFVPLTSVRKIDYDREKKTFSATVLSDGGAETTLLGSTKFTSNKITIEGEALLDGLGAATVKFNGGIDKGLHSVKFPDAKPADKLKGATAVVTADDKEKTKHTAHDVQPVFLVDGQYRVMAYVMFKKTVKIDWDNLAGLRFVPSEDKKKISTDYLVTLKDGVKHTLSILNTVELEKKKTMTFVGLIGRVPVGYKLFMLDAIYEYQLTAEEKK
ncbi:MAG: hypothetical protein EXR98_07990 [Gemmataceae bacterium]|nr:hypothetical protein [Gemmataceae bacterium]